MSDEEEEQRRPAGDDAKDSSYLPVFISKLRRMLEPGENEDAIQWGNEGTTVRYVSLLCMYVSLLCMRCWRAVDLDSCEDDNVHKDPMGIRPVGRGFAAVLRRVEQWLGRLLTMVTEDEEPRRVERGELRVMITNTKSFVVGGQWCHATVGVSSAFRACPMTSGRRDSIPLGESVSRG
jgi:hypothetical protein